MIVIFGSVSTTVFENVAIQQNMAPIWVLFVRLWKKIQRLRVTGAFLALQSVQVTDEVVRAFAALKPAAQFPYSMG